MSRSRDSKKAKTPWEIYEKNNVNDDFLEGENVVTFILKRTFYSFNNLQHYKDQYPTVVDYRYTIKLLIMTLICLHKCVVKKKKKHLKHNKTIKLIVALTHYHLMT